MFVHLPFPKLAPLDYRTIIIGDCLQAHDYESKSDVLLHKYMYVYELCYEV